jgi:hypothetical protein
MLLITQQRYTITNIKDHAQTLLQTITRPQLYSECASAVQVSKTQAASVLSDSKDESAARVFYI